MEFSYFQEHESEQFTFFRIPKILFSDERFAGLSSEAKILYGLMLDRVGLSRKNGWIDQNGNVYIQYTIEEMMSVLKWTRYRIYQLLDELDTKENGIGLIERKRVGLNKPNLIYVKNFASVNRTRGEPEVREPDVRKSDISDIRMSEESNTDSFFIRKSESVYSCGSFQNVILADRELKELKHRFPYDWQNWIERLSSYMASTGKKYRNHYATICSWAVKEQKNIPGKNYDLPEGKGF